MFDPRLRAPVALDRLPFGCWPLPERLPADGLGAVGGDLSEARLISAYEHGYFPCYGEDTPRLWWNPDPRAVFIPDGFHASSRLVRRMRQGRLRATWDTAFRRVIAECGERRDGDRWILPEIVAAYTGLHESGRAHSLEVWRDDRLVGGVYGVACGAVFAAESMFHVETDASKVALAYLLPGLFRAGIEIVDVQFLSPHLASLGARAIPRAEYVAALRDRIGTAVDLRTIELKPPPAAFR